MRWSVLGVCLCLLVVAGCSKKEAAAPSASASTSAQPASSGTAAVVPTSSTATPAVASTVPEPSLVSLSAGALVVQKPQEYNEGWSALYMLDERADSGWATPKGIIGNQVIVIELPERTLLNTLVFDTARVDGEGRDAKDVLVEMSDVSATAGFRTIARVALAPRANNQVFPVSAQVAGRWVRLNVKNNHGSPEYVEIMDFRAHGKQLTTTPFPDVSGTYHTNYGDMHIRQQGTSVIGCYEYADGLLQGGIEGRIMKFTWREGPTKEGPAMMVFTSDGKQLLGLWWTKGNENSPGSVWLGPKRSSEVGTCPHWSGGVEQQMAKDLEQFGKTRVYGINFDSDSDRIKDESRPTLDKIVAVLKSKPDWKLMIEGHTDSTATMEHNQQLSDRRAKAVKSYLEGAGVAASRLSSGGFGATRPVAPNDNAIGRAQNRRVELIKM